MASKEELLAQLQELRTMRAQLDEPAQDFSQQPEQDSGSYIGGAAAGYLKNIGTAVTAPADLLARAGIAGVDYLSGSETSPESIQQYLPSSIVDRGVNSLVGDMKLNPTAEAIGGGVGTVAGFLAAPNLTSAVTKATGPVATTLPAIVGQGAKYAPRAMPIVPRVAAIGATGAAEGALISAGMEAGDLSPDYNTAMKQGAIYGGLGAAAGPIVGEIAGDIAPALGRMGDRNFERSLGGTASAFVKSEQLSGSLPSSNTSVIETRLANAFRGIRETEEIPLLATQQTKASVIQGLKSQVGDEIGGIVSSLDDVGIQPKMKTDNLDKLLNSAAFTNADDIKAQGAAIMDSFRNWDGTAVGLHRGKSALGSMGYSQAPGATPAKISAAVQRAAEKDMRIALQEALVEGVTTGKLDPQIYDDYLKANSRFSNLAQVEELSTKAAVSSQHQKIPSWQQAAWTTGGFGLPMAAAYSQYGLPGAIATGAAGMLSKTSAGQGILAAAQSGSSSALSELNRIVQNPYVTQAAMVSALPRNTSEIKSDLNFINTIQGMAVKMGLITPEQNLSKAPDAVLEQIVGQVSGAMPEAFEPTPDNVNVVNGKLQSQFDQSILMQQALEKSPIERAKTMPDLWKKKYVPQATLPMQVSAQPVAPDISQLNGLLSPSASSMPNPVMTDAQSMVDQLNAITAYQDEFIQ